MPSSFRPLPIAAQYRGPSSRTTATFAGVACDARVDAERRGDARERAERVGREQMDIERLLQPAELRLDVVDQVAAVGERAVDVEEEVSELEGRPAGDFDRPHRGSSI
jgi:hypothetical protein